MKLKTPTRKASKTSSTACRLIVLPLLMEVQTRSLRKAAPRREQSALKHLVLNALRRAFCENLMFFDKQYQTDLFCLRPFSTICSVKLCDTCISNSINYSIVTHSKNINIVPSSRPFQKKRFKALSIISLYNLCNL